MNADRPKRGETDDDLLKMQQDFLNSQSTPAAKVVRVGGKRKSDDIPTENVQEPRDIVSLGEMPSSFEETKPIDTPKKTKFKERNEQKLQWPGPPMPDIEEDPEELLDKHDRHITKILSDIVEKDTRAFPVYFPRQRSSAFPDTFHRDSLKANQLKRPAGKKQSIFAQQFSKKKSGMESSRGYRLEEQAVKDIVMEAEPSRSDEEHSQYEPSCHNPEAEKKTIHEDNLAKLSEMSEEEILAERQQLLQTIDPKLVAFLQKRSGDGSSGGVSPSPRSQPARTKPAQSDSQPEEMDCTAGADNLEKLPLRPEKNWVNMNKIEYEKLEWMEDLPTPKAGDLKTGQPARFDFQGNILASDVNLPTFIGLHHHGSEPERAGYSLEELFQLGRSANMQQRFMALNTLARIIVNARLGKFSECLSSPVIPTLLDGGLAFLCRWALDDSTDNTMVAALHLTHSLLVCSQDEEAADHVFYWYRGHELPELCKSSEEEEEEEGGEGEKPNTDADIVKEDLIKGFLRMSFLSRLRYILEVWKPDPYVVLQILDILIRIARHSSQASYQVVQCPRMMDFIVSQFLTLETSSEGSGAKTAYGRSVGRAVKLLRVISSAGKHMAANLVSKYHLMERIGRYLAASESDLPPALDDDSDVQLECWKLWRVCAGYGTGETLFREFYGILMTGFQKLCNVTPHSPLRQQLETTSCVGLFEAMTSLASASQLARSKGQSQSEMPAVPEIDWSHVVGLAEPICVCLKKHLNHFTASYFEKRFDIGILSVCLNYLATFYTRVDSQPGYDPLQMMESMDSLCEEFLIPCLKSQAFKAALKGIREHSMLLYSESPDRSEGLDAIAELGSLVGEGAVTCPVIRQTSTINFVVAMLRVLCAMGKVNKTIPAKVHHYVLQSEETLLYARKICQTHKAKNAENYFTKWECWLQCLLLQMARQMDAVVDHKIYHQMSLNTLISLPQGCEHEAHELLSTVIFNEVFLQDVTTELSSPLSGLGERLTLDEPHPLTSATQEVIHTTRAQLLKDTSKHLVDIRSTYLQSAASMVTNLQKSRYRALSQCMEVERCLTGPVSETMLPVDWMFVPLLEMYNKAIEVKSRDKRQIPDAIVLKTVTNCLRWVHFLECYRPSSLASVPPPVKLTRIMCTFLAGSDLFLDKAVHSYLAGLLQLFCTPLMLDRLDLEAKIPGLASFYDFFILFLEHYESVSFGDSLFGCYLLLPLQQKHNVDLRRAIWGEHDMVLRSLFIPINELIIPADRFLEPEESSVPMLNVYFKALFSTTVHPKRSPLLYLIAIHHINRFVYRQTGPHHQLRQGMLQEIVNCKKLELKKNLLYYKQFNAESCFGIELYHELPQNRQNLLAKLQF